MEVDDEAAYMTFAEFERLSEYSVTLPTGQTTGKRWKRRIPYIRSADVLAEWHLGEYGEPEGDQQPIIWRQICIVTNHEDR